ncbi:hypothetical protein A2859_05825 [Candidatus Roizmanbacteria bacterium RIFCSPHIGHO2_01_FULL_37_16b]|nr:MAG: hypothetical protein A2859_05825 [Candidatus Roizmanbacteria bacterium RIFCSPHIGHO2_01_FULL_37_16b]
MLLKYKQFFHAFLLLLVAFIFSASLTWPLIKNLYSYYENSGDYALNGWFLFYMQKSILTGKIFDQESLFNTGAFYPLPYTLAFSDHLFIPSLVFLSIFAFTKNLVFSVNLFTLLTFILTFITSFLFVHNFLKNSYASLVGAFIFTFNPITLNLINTLQLTNKFFLPLVYLYAYKFFSKPSFKNGILFYLFFTLNALSSIYYQIFTVVTLPLFFIPFFSQYFLRKDFNYFLKLIKYSLIFFIFLPLLLYFNLPYLDFSKKEAYRPLEENQYYSARISDFLFSSETNLLYGGIARKYANMRNPKEKLGKVEYFNSSEHTLFTNILPTLLYLIGIIFVSKKLIKKKSLRLIALSFGILALSSLILMFGPFFLGWNSNEGTIKLPFYYLYNYFKPLEGIRVPTRFQFIFYIPFSLFAAYGFYAITHKLKRITAFFIFVAFLILISLENFTPSFFNPTPSIIEELNWLKNNQNLAFLKNRIILHLPTIPDHIIFDEVRYLNWKIFTDEVVINGYSDYVPPDWEQFITEVAANFDQEEVKKLKSLGLDYVVVHKDALDNSNKKKYALNPRKWLKVVYQDKKIIIYDLTQFNFSYKICEVKNFISDLSFPSKLPSSEKLYITLDIKNKSNCYLPNKFQDRYLEANIFLNKNKYRIYFKMPILIEPYTRYTLGSYLKKYKNFLEFHKKGTYKIQVFINKLNLYTYNTLEVY